MKTLTKALALTLAFALPATAQDEVAPAPVAPKPVKLMTVQAGDTPPARQFFGKVVARQTVDLAFQVGGEVTDFPVIEGQMIEQDELIASLDMEIFQLQFEQARLQKDQADRTLARLSKLAGSSVSQVTIDDAETAQMLGAVALRQTEYNIEHAMLIAPWDALVAARLTSEHNMTAAGSPVVRLHDMSEIRVEIDVPEVLFQRTKESDAVSITARFPAKPGQEFPMYLREFNAEASETGQSFRVTLGMEPVDDLHVLPGSSVEVTVRMMTGATGINLPSTALIPLNSAGDVAVMLYMPGDDPDAGKVVLHPVTVVVTNAGTFAATEGLSGGEEIVLTGATALKDGQVVRRFTGFAN